MNKFGNSSPSINCNEQYWISKGKIGKKCIIYFHDDMDGIFSAIIMKSWLINHKFDIEGYAIINYQEGYSTLTMNPDYINIVLDFADLPDKNFEADTYNNIDVYIDHHGQFDESSKENNKKAIKTKTGSAYEGICYQLNLSTDYIVLSIIDMIDSAKYEEYNVDIKNILEFEPSKFKNTLEFAASFNQLLKRTDYKTFIEVVANHPNTHPSIYRIYSLFKRLFPANNLDNIELKKIAKKNYNLKIGVIKNDYIDMTNDDFVSFLKDEKQFDILSSLEKSFVIDGQIRLREMTKRTRGNEKQKTYIKNQEDFKEKLQVVIEYGKQKIQIPGYQIIGNLVFIPTGCWSNALRAKALIEQDMEEDSNFIPFIEYEILHTNKIYKELKDGEYREFDLIQKDDKIIIIEDLTDKDVKGFKGRIIIKNGKKYFKTKQLLYWIMLQYGNTLQVASIDKISKYNRKYLPKLKDGSIVDNLGEYSDKLLKNFIDNFGYNINLVPETKTTFGGHEGICSGSNILGKVSRFNISNTELGQKYDSIKFLDLIKNKIINDLSGVNWSDLTMSWNDEEEKNSIKKEYLMNKKLMMIDDIRFVDIDRTDD